MVEAGHADQAQDVLHPPLACGFRHAAHLEAEGDVLRHRHMRKERIVLEDDADVAMLGQDVGDVAARKHDDACISRAEAGDDPEQRRLA